MGVVGGNPLSLWAATAMRCMASLCLACSSAFLRCSWAVSYSSCACSRMCLASAFTISAMRNLSAMSDSGCTKSLPRGLITPTRPSLSCSALSLMKPSATALLMMSSWLSPHERMLSSRFSLLPLAWRKLYSRVSMSRRREGSVLRQWIFVDGCDLVAK